MTAPILQLPIKVLRSATAGRRPGDGTFRALTDGELFVNTQDRVACMLDASGALFAFPIDPNVLATQSFVTGNFGAANPSMAGTAATGSATTAARSDHVHPIDTSRAKAGANTDITSLSLNSLSCSGAGTFGNALSTSGVVLTSLGGDGVFQSRLQYPGTTVNATVAAAQSAAGPSVTLVSVANLAVGMYAFGGNVPFPCRITAIDTGKSVVTLSVATSAALPANAVVSFSAVGYDTGWRYDGSALYLMRTQKGVGNQWDGARPFVYSVNNDLLSLSATAIALNGAVTSAGVTITSAAAGNGSTRLYDDGNGHLDSGNKPLWLNQAGGTVNMVNGSLVVPAGGGQISMAGRPTWGGATPYDTANLSAGQLNAIAGQTLLGTANATRDQLAAQFGYYPAVNYWSGAHNIGLSFDGSNLINVVDGNGGFGVSWDSHNFNPGGKCNIDGGVSVVGYNSGDSRNPYISGNAYRELMISETSYKAVGVRGCGAGNLAYVSSQYSGDVVYMPRTNGGNYILLYWNGSQPVFVVDSTAFGLATTSDRRLKDIKGDVERDRASDIVSKLKPVAYEYNSLVADRSTFDEGERLGFVAQDLAPLLPTAVRDGSRNEDGSVYKLLSHDAAVQLCAVLVKSQQAMLDRIAALEARNT